MMPGYGDGDMKLRKRGVDDSMSEQRIRLNPITRSRLLMVGALAALTVLGACEGDNLFVGEPGTINPGAPTVEITEPANGSSTPSIGQLRVRTNVRDQSGIRRVTFEGYAIRGDSTTNTTIVPRYVTQVVDFPQPPSSRMPRDTTLIRFLDLVQGENRSERVFIKVTAEDSTGATNSAVTEILLGGPVVQLRSPGNNTQVQTGLAMTVSAFAFDPAGGVDSMEIVVSGAQNQTFAFGGLAAADSVSRTATLDITAGSGSISVVAYAWNRSRIRGASPVATASIVTVAVNDTARPVVSMVAGAERRLELLERHSVTVSARHNGGSGLRRIGAVVRAIPSNPAVPERTIYLDTTFAGSARTGVETVNLPFSLADFGYTETSVPGLPFNVTLQIHAFGISGAGRCGANTTATLTAMPCDTVQAHGRTFGTVTGSTGLSQAITAVAGYQVRDSRLTGNTIADLTLDSQRQRLYLSNWSQNRVEVLRLTDSTFTSAVSVGSQPWGMFINNDGSRLIVANSGGTNISFVDISGPTVPTREEPSERVLTPNLQLIDFTFSISNGSIRYTGVSHGFSDRPQFIAQDAQGTILYSTEPTQAASLGSVRYIDETGGRRESKLLFTADAITNVENAIAIAHIDSALIRRPTNGPDLVNLFDHIPGQTTVIQSGYRELQEAIDSLVAKGSDLVFAPGVWNVQQVGLSDTTYVAASGDRSRIAFGGGAMAPFGRIWLWSAADRRLSHDIEVLDLVENAAERVFGVSLNQNGTMGAGRGTRGAYFFSNNVDFEGELRLQGTFDSPLQNGMSGGVALHPLHSEVRNSNETTLAFVAASDSTIKIVDTFHFRSRGAIAIKGTMVGPLRAGLPALNENAGLSNCDRIEVKLYGLMRTAAGSPSVVSTRAVIINVRRKDISGFPGCS